MSSTKRSGIAPVIAALLASSLGLGLGADPAAATVTPGASSLTVAAGATGTRSVSVSVPAGTTSDADIEIAIDTTGSMAGGIAQARADATALVTAVQASAPGAQFAVVEFRDSTDANEYRVVQPMTASAASVQSAVNTLTAGGGADSPEAYNTVFHNSAVPATGGPIGWRNGSAKFVVVLGDAQPHGAGSAGVAGCTDTSPDPHGLNSASVLAEMRSASRTLFMLLEPGSVTSTVACYQGLAARAYPGGQGAAGGTNLATQIVGLIGTARTTVDDLHLAVATVSPAPAAASWISTTPAAFGPLTTPFTVNPTIRVAVPAGTPNGTYRFDLVALADGADVGHHILNVTVTGGFVFPSRCTDDPGGTVTPIVGTPGPDVIYGTPDDDVIYGLGGNDKIYGLEGDDALCGGAGADTLVGGANDDTVDGEAGNDRVSGSAGNDDVWGGLGVNKLFGNAGGDVLEGGPGVDAHDGGVGVDECNANGGADTFVACEDVGN